MKTEELLGRTVRDRVTGITGMCTSVAKHLTGCDTLGIQPPLKEDGSVPDSFWVDVLRVEIVDGPVYKQPVPPPLAGG